MAVLLAATLILSPEPLTHEPPATPLQAVNTSWNTHPEGWDQIQDELEAQSSRPTSGSPEYEGMGSDVEQWRPLVAGHFEPGDVDRVLCLMGYESGGNPNARNQSSSAAGLMQVMPFWAPEFGLSYDQLFTPEINLYVARQIRDSQGWGAWAPYNRGLCR